MDIVISHLNFNLKHHDKCKFALKLISLATISNLFSRSSTELPTLCIMGKFNLHQCKCDTFSMLPYYDLKGSK